MHRLAVDLDFDLFAGQGIAGHLVLAEPERARFPGEGAGQPGDLLGLGQHTDHVGGPALFGQHGDQPGVESTGGHQDLDRVGQHLSGHVVHVGLEHQEVLSVAGHVRQPAPLPPPRRPEGRSGHPASSAAPAPYPPAVTFMGGSGPNDVTSPASSAAPVGVVSSTVWLVPWTGTPARSSTTAGAGLGSTPCAPRTVPVPRATGLANTEDTSNDSRARQVPITSISASRPPTSWKCTSSGLTPWTAALGDGQAAEDLLRSAPGALG